MTDFFSKYMFIKVVLPLILDMKSGRLSEITLLTKKAQSYENDASFLSSMNVFFSTLGIFLVSVLGENQVISADSLLFTTYSV